MMADCSLTPQPRDGSSMYQSGRKRRAPYNRLEHLDLRQVPGKCETESPHAPPHKRFRYLHPSMPHACDAQQKRLKFLTKYNAKRLEACVETEVQPQTPPRRSWLCTPDRTPLRGLEVHDTPSPVVSFGLAGCEEFSALAAATRSQEAGRLKEELCINENCEVKSRLKFPIMPAFPPLEEQLMGTFKFRSESEAIHGRSPQLDDPNSPSNLISAHHSEPFIDVSSCVNENALHVQKHALQQTPDRSRRSHHLRLDRTPERSEELAMEPPKTPQAPNRFQRSRRSLVHGIISNNRREVIEALSSGEDPNETISFPDRITGKRERLLPVLATIKMTNSVSILEALLKCGAVANGVSPSGQTGLHLLSLNANYSSVSPNFIPKSKARNQLKTTAQPPDSWLSLKTFLDNLVPEKELTSPDSPPDLRLPQNSDDPDISLTPRLKPRKMSTKIDSKRASVNVSPGRLSISSPELHSKASGFLESEALAIANLLIDNGADPNRKDIFEKTALDYAEQNSFASLSSLLRQRMKVAKNSTEPSTTKLDDTDSIQRVHDKCQCQHGITRLDLEKNTVRRKSMLKTVNVEKGCLGPENVGQIRTTERQANEGVVQIEATKWLKRSCEPPDPPPPPSTCFQQSTTVVRATPIDTRAHPSRSQTDSQTFITSYLRSSPNSKSNQGTNSPTTSRHSKDPHMSPKISRPPRSRKSK